MKMPEKHLTHSGFTMIELVFVIVIIGILSVVAVTYMVATRDSAMIVNIKSDIRTAVHAIPAWYTGQKDIRIFHAVDLNTRIWQRPVLTEEAYTWHDGEANCVTIAIFDQNNSNAINDGVADSTDINATTGQWSGMYSPVLRIIDEGSASSLCREFWNDATLKEMNITVAGSYLQRG